jgi:hypothetical protein
MKVKSTITETRAASWEEKIIAEKRKWIDKLDGKELIDNLPVIKNPGSGQRVQMPIYPSQEILADKLKEARPDLFKRRLDVYRSLLYLGGQIWEHVFKTTNKLKLGEIYEFHLACEDVLSPSHDLDIIRSKIRELAESYGKGNLSHAVLMGQRDNLKNKLNVKFHEKYLEMWEDEFENNEEIAKMNERLRKREYRKRKNANGLSVV